MDNGFDVLSTVTSLQVSSRGGTYKVVSDVPVSVAAGERVTTLFMPTHGTHLMRVHERIQTFETQRPRTMSRSSGTRCHLKMPMKTWAESLSKNWSGSGAPNCPAPQYLGPQPCSQCPPRALRLETPAAGASARRLARPIYNCKNQASHLPQGNIQRGTTAAAKRLTAIDIGEMHFNHWQTHRQNCITDSNAGMRVGPGLMISRAACVPRC